MLTFRQKTEILKTTLKDIGDSYAESFKTDLLFYFGDFEPEDTRLAFLEKLDSKEEIERWVERMTSLIVMKLDEEEEGLYN